MRSTTIKTKIIFVLLAGLTFLCCYPILFLLSGSFMGNSELSQNLGTILSGTSGEFANWKLIPQYPTLQSYIEVLFDEPEFYVMFWNTIKVVIGVILGQLLIGIPAAWGFAKYEFPFRKTLFSIYIVLMLLPFQVLMLPEYLVLDRLNLMDTLWAVILPGIFSTFPVFITYNFFRGIPDSILEAARLDGATEFQVFLKVGVPIGMPGIISALILQFLEYWSLIEQPMTFLKTKSLWPLSLYLPSISLENIGQALVSSLIALIPSMLVFLAGQKNLEKGIAATAVKQ